MNNLQSIILEHLRSHHFEKMEPLAALIDMDGTLYDSMPRHTQAWHRLATELGIEATREEFYLYEGRTGASTLDILFQRAYGRNATMAEVEEYYHRKTVYFNELPEVGPMPGAADMLSTLMAAGMRRVLVTGSGQSSLINRLDTDFPGAFAEDMRVTSHSVTHGKPHPEPFIKAMQLARVRPSQAIAIENAPLGVKAASASGAFTIGITTGPIPAEELRKAGATIVYPSMMAFAEELPELLLQLFAVTNR